MLNQATLRPKLNWACHIVTHLTHGTASRQVLTLESGIDSVVVIARNQFRTPTAGRFDLFAEGELLSLTGHGLPQDIDRAWYWFKEAAKPGFEEVRLNLGKMYREGRDWLKILPNRIIIFP